MLKWFRKYNKYILAVGASLLMVAFLMPQACQNVGRGGANYTIGTIGGEDGLEIKLQDQHEAALELETLKRVFQTRSPLLEQFAGLADLQPMPWLLMKHEASKMGLSAGRSQAAALLAAMGVNDESGRHQMARQLDITTERLFAVLANWIIIQEYRELVLGRAHLPVGERLAAYLNSLDRYQKLIEQMMQDQGGNRFRLQQELWGLSQQISAIGQQQGSARLSEPVVRRHLADRFDRISIAAVPISTARHLGQIAEPDTPRLTELFERYKDDLPGAGEPYGLGYRFPDRVKIEYLAVPLDRVLKVAEIAESDAVEYYDAHHDEFTETPPAETPPVEAPAAEAPAADGAAKPEASQAEPQPVLLDYPEVRDRIVRQLKQAAAEELSRKIINAARSILSEGQRGLIRDEGGYVIIPDTWQAMPLDEVAGKLQEQFGVLPNVTRLDDRWLDEAALAGLEGIGNAFLEVKQRARFGEYAMSVKELDSADEEHPLRSLALQAKTPSHALTGYDGSRYLFRLIDADPAHSPQALDEVRARVAADARKLAAYQKLIDEAPTWARRLDETELDELAQELGTEVIKPRPFVWRQVDQSSGALTVPEIDQIGRSVSFVDAAFELGRRAAISGDDIQALSNSLRSAAIRDDSAMVLYLVRIEKYESMKRSQYDMFAGAPFASQGAESAIIGAEPPDALSMEALSARLGYVQAADE